MRYTRTASILVALAVGLPGSALAFSFSGSSGTLSARATFSVNTSSELEVLLENTSTFDTLVPSDLLTAVFFDIVGNPTLTPVSAMLGPGSTVVFPPSESFGTPNDGLDSSGGVGGEWAYRSDVAAAVGDGRGSQGLSSTGLDDVFGPPDRFPGENLQGPASPNGMQYGILSEGDDPTTGNRPVTGPNALINNSVRLTLSGLDGGFTVNDISNVSFQYGTSQGQPHFPGSPPDVGPPGDPNVPEPPSLALFALGVVALSRLGSGRRRVSVDVSRA